VVAERSVLVVDDDPKAAHLIAQALEEQGYHTVVAPDGSEIWSILELTTVDLVILELLMPGMNGWEVIRRLRPRFWPTLPPGPSPCKIIAVCGRADEETVTFVRRLGADAFLPKPVAPPVLLRTVSALLGPRPRRSFPHQHAAQHSVRDIRTGS
jgi:two-component system OmpR family response regulator